MLLKEKLCPAALMCGPVRDSPGGRVQKIIAAGGHSGNDQGDGGFPLNTVEVYDISLNTWETGVYDNDHIKGDHGEEHSQISVSKSLKKFQVPGSLIHLVVQLSLNMTTPSISLEVFRAAATVIRS